jgi:urea transport system permease protein
MSLIGAVYGALLVNFAKTYFSESFPALWLICMGALFISVVMFFPNGLAGLYSSHIRPRIVALVNRRRGQSDVQPMPARPVDSKAPEHPVADPVV